MEGGRRNIEIFKLFGTILVDSAGAEKSISKTGKASEGLATKLGNGIKTVAKWRAAIAAAAVAAGTAMFAAAGKVADATDEIDKASRRAGTDAETWQKLKYAMDQSGISAETLEKSMVKNQQALNKAADGNKAAVAAYEELGIAIYDADGKLRESDQVYQETIKSLADMEDINQRNAVANTLFGKSYADLAPVLDSGSAGIDALTSRAEQLGLVLGQDTVDAGVKFGDTLSDVKQMFGQLGLAIAGQLLPLLQRGLDFVIDHAPDIIGAVKSVTDGVSKAIAWITDFWDAHGTKILEITKKVFEAIRFVIEKVMNVIKGIIEVVMGVIQGDWDRVWSGMKTILSNTVDFWKNAIRVALDAIVTIITGWANVFWGAGKAVFGALWDGIKSVWDSIASWVSDKVSWLADKLMFWRNSNDEMASGVSGIDGSHAGGLPYVPYDGYVAKLHRGERVLSAAENAGQGTGESVIYNYFTIKDVQIRSDNDIKKLAEQIYDLQRREARGRGVVPA